ncbi:hypothetical protein GCM10027290_02940 [Micromonospora sonneratiae]
MLRAVHWYLRELTGESAYDHYVQRHRNHGGGAPLLTRREFERQRARRRDDQPGIRCC